MADETVAVSGHYGRQHLGELIRDGLQAVGKADGHLTTDELAPIDQFHTGGKATTFQLAQLADFEAGSACSGCGRRAGRPGPRPGRDERLQRHRLGFNAEFCEVGAWLTERTWLTDQVQFKVGDALAMPFADGSFDAAWTQHSSMNIRDKEALYREIRRVVRSGGRLAIHEIMAGPKQPIHFPVPWAPEPSISFLRPPAEIRALLQTLGFREIAWNDTSAEAISWFKERIAAAQAAKSTPPLGLHLLLGASAPQMFGNMLRNLEEGRVQTIQAVFART